MDWSLSSLSSLSFLAFRRWFWSESFWLPPNVTWKDLENPIGSGGAESPVGGDWGPPGARGSDGGGGDQSTVTIPSVYDLWMSLPLAVGLFGLRLLWERYVAHPLGLLHNFRQTPLATPPPNATLEEAFRLHGKTLPDHGKILGYAKQLDLTPRQVERWWRRRQLLRKPSQLQRFKEASWRFVYYLCSFWSGLYVLWDKPWLWETNCCWQNYPRQHVPTDIWWYYLIELGFYLSLVLSLFRDVRRKDFREMMIHHIATISLMTLSWSNNMIRIGTLVLCVHDTVDYWLEAAKLANYCKYSRLCNSLFVVFAVLWFVTRLIIFPFRILHNTLFEGHLKVGMFPMYYLYNVLLCVLQVLHVIWFYMILRTFGQWLVLGKIEKDNRSDTEPEIDSDDGTVAHSNVTNGDAAMAMTARDGGIGRQRNSISH